MYYLATEAVSRIGVPETVMLILGVGLSLVHLAQLRSRKPAGRILRLATWLPLIVALIAIKSNYALTRETYSYLQQQDAINAMQRQVLFQECYRGSTRLFLFGVGCSAAIWMLLGSRSALVRDRPNAD